MYREQLENLSYCYKRVVSYVRTYVATHLTEVMHTFAGYLLALAGVCNVT